MFSVWRIQNVTAVIISHNNGGLGFTYSIPYTSNCGEKDFTERSKLSSVTDSCAWEKDGGCGY